MRVIDESRDILRIGGVDHIEEELAVREVSHISLLREVFGELGLGHDLFVPVPEAYPGQSREH